MSKVQYAYNEIKTRIQESYWDKGEKITSERDLANLLNVSRVTIKSAIAKLIEEKYLIYKEGKKGTFVAEKIENNNEINTICVAIDNQTPAFSSFLLQGIHDTLLNKNFHTLYFNTLFNDGDILNQINSSVLNKISGFIFAPLLGEHNIENNKKIINILEKNNIALVQVDRYITNDYGHYVGTNNEEGFYKLSNEIIKKNFKNIVVVTGCSASSCKERLKGIEKALQNKDYEIININESDYINDKKVKLNTKDLKIISNADAIICINQDLCKIVEKYNNHCFYASISSSETEVIGNLSLIQPMYEIGKESARLILESIINKNKGNKKILINPYLYTKN